MKLPQHRNRNPNYFKSSIMDNQTDFEKLLCAAQAGDKSAQIKVYAILNERFLWLIKRQLHEKLIISKRINLEDSCCKICQKAIAEIERMLPVNNPNWSLKKAINILHNVITDFILGKLVDFAKEGDAAAENLLFHIIRNKLMERIDRKRWSA